MGGAECGEEGEVCEEPKQTRSVGPGFPSGKDLT